MTTTQNKIVMSVPLKSILKAIQIAKKFVPMSTALPLTARNFVRIHNTKGRCAIDNVDECGNVISQELADAKFEDNFSFIVNVREFNSRLSAFGKKATISFDIVDSNTIVMSDEDTGMRVGIPSSLEFSEGQFPSITLPIDAKEIYAPLYPAEFVNAIKVAEFTTALDDFHKQLNYVLVKNNTAVSTDTHCMTIYPEIDGDLPEEIYLRYNVIAGILATVDTTLGFTLYELEDKFVMLAHGTGVLIQFGKPVHVFPNWERILPKSFNGYFHVEAEVLNNALTSMKKLNKATESGDRVIFTYADDKLTLSNTGGNEITIPLLDSSVVTCNGTDFSKFALNVQFMLDMVKALHTEGKRETITILANDCNRPFVCSGYQAEPNKDATDSCWWLANTKEPIVIIMPMAIG